MLVVKREMKHLDKNLPLATIKEHFHMRLSDVARKFDCCPTLLKQHCRKLGIERWPYRTTKKVAKQRSRMRKRYGDAAWDSIESRISTQEPELLAPGDSAATMLAGWRKIEEAAEQLQGDRRRVKIWNKIKKRKTAGMAAPFASHLVDFLERNPECEVYNGQDLIERQERSCSPRTSSESSLPNQDPMNDAWSVSPTSVSFESAPSSSESCELGAPFDTSLNSLPEADLMDFGGVTMKDLELLSDSIEFDEQALDRIDTLSTAKDPSPAIGATDILSCDFFLDDLLSTAPTCGQGESLPICVLVCCLFAAAAAARQGITEVASSGLD